MRPGSDTSFVTLGRLLNLWPLIFLIDLAFRKCLVLGKSEKANFTLSLLLNTAVKFGQNVQSSYLKTLKSIIIGGGLGKKARIQNTTEPYPPPMA